MSTEGKDENSTTVTDIKEEDSLKPEKINVESSKDSENDKSGKEDGKEQSDQEDEAKEESEEEEGMGLLDRPVEVTGCRARKKVERLEYSMTTPKDKLEIPEGLGQKLGECPRIEHQIQKTSAENLSPLHRILFGRKGSGNEIKKNIRKFSGFAFEKESSDFEKKKSAIEKFTMANLKRMCEILDIEKGGTKDEIITRLLDFLLNPKDSGKKVTSKRKSSNKETKKSEKKAKNEKQKSKKVVLSDEADSNVDSSKEASGTDGESELSDKEKEKKEESKAKKTSKAKTKKNEKPKKEVKNTPAKASKRKRDMDSTDDDDDDDDGGEPAPKKSKVPSDDEIKTLVKKILEHANLHEITMKKVIKQVGEKYPGLDLSQKKAFIKSTIKSVIS